ncbi:MAG: AraC family transcriptional regulator [Capnocytophaga sp.]|nr:AraC family transcriptional regulator [Capnocytophaga sp.]
MHYREIPATGYLSHFVKEFWEYADVDTCVEHTILPDGVFDLIVEFSGGKINLVKLTGIWTHPINVKNEKTTHYFGIRFKLLAVEYLLNEEIKSILNTSKNLPLSFWNIASYSQNDFEKFVKTSSEKILELVQKQEIDSRKFKLFDLIYQNLGFSVEEISQKIGWSDSQINQYFNQQFGFSLKAFQNIIRCNASYEDIAQGDLFPNEHFYDQSHFIKEIKKHTQTTPLKLYKNQENRYLQIETKKKINQIQAIFTILVAQSAVFLSFDKL